MGSETSKKNKREREKSMSSYEPMMDEEESRRGNDKYSEKKSKRGAERQCARECVYICKYMEK